LIAAGREGKKKDHKKVRNRFLHAIWDYNKIKGWHLPTLRLQVV
jgi:hypothetical protein